MDIACSNVLIERLGRSIRYQEIYLREYVSVAEEKVPRDWRLRLYSVRRNQLPLDRQTSDEVYLRTEGAA